MCFAGERFDTIAAGLVSKQTFAPLKYENVLEYCRRWSRGDVVHTFHAEVAQPLVREVMQQLIAELINNGATAGGGVGAHMPDEDAYAQYLQYLKDHEYVQQLPNVEWLFTDGGLCKVRTCWTVHSPKRYFTRWLDLTHIQSTAWELCDFLLSSE